MTDQTPPPSDPTAAPAAPAVPPAPAYAAPPAPAYAAPAPAYGAPAGGGPVGQIRSTGMSMLLFIVTFSIYGYVWYFKTGEERKQYSGNGLGGGLSLLIGFFVSPVMLFLVPAEIGNLQAQYGQQKTVSGPTGFWVLIPLVGSIIWFVKVNGALNEFWKSQGATAA
ncbi:MAG TPA: DUF4234 domain-containing protein [Marmoricola sp.]|jgi:hypothetical protein|nr:DUF4234 domain-containing protein [Marmoricola sp.]